MNERLDKALSAFAHACMDLGGAREYALRAGSTTIDLTGSHADNEALKARQELLDTITAAIIDGAGFEVANVWYCRRKDDGTVSIWCPEAPKLPEDRFSTEQLYRRKK